ncbi:hypothetical protein BBJ28_00018175 [Nothophytophthora sp. Chile5]|nr:hypothetical protein BBJ28_00018175 [Nothophytophthora sp. Chile5]
MVPGLLGLTSVSAASASEEAFLSLPTFEIPAFDYASLTQGDMPSTLLETLQVDGIVALRHVPNFVNMREKYLDAAAECAVAAAHSAESDFLSEKNFEDGTRRYTINTNAGLELATAAENTRKLCPGYRELYLEFSALLENAVNGFGVALDQTSFTASDGHRVISSRQLVSEAVRLDHFHAYQASTIQAEAAVPADAEHRKLEFSLPLHEDHGLFIAMIAPKFFEVHGEGEERRLVERELANDASGLVIQRASGQKVRPVLKEDEVFIMMGTGGSRWLQTSHRIPAVMHGMRMPDSLVQNEHRSLRAWFGKMTLLPAYQRLLENNDATFAEHANMTTRFLLESTDDDLKTIGCATGRMLTASEGSCTHRSCTTKSGATAPADGCATVCNREGHSSTDESECSEKCSCTDDSGSGELCWMLCFHAHSDDCNASDDHLGTCHDLGACHDFKSSDDYLQPIDDAQSKQWNVSYTHDVEPKQRCFQS